MYHSHKNLPFVSELVPYLFFRNIYCFLALSDLRNNGLRTQTNFLKPFLSNYLLTCYNLIRISSLISGNGPCVRVCVCVCTNMLTRPSEVSHLSGEKLKTTRDHG